MQTQLNVAPIQHNAAPSQDQLQALVNTSQQLRALLSVESQIRRLQDMLNRGQLAGHLTQEQAQQFVQSQVNTLLQQLPASLMPNNTGFP